jgi:HK97 family phage portal protein
MASKLRFGNTYVLKQRDSRGVVVAMSVLDPTVVTVLVAPDGAVYYQLQRNDLAGVPQEGIAVPASEIIHDLMVPLFHPLIGVSPIYACGTAALQGLKIQDNSTSFFANGSAPGGVISVPFEIEQDAADRLMEKWNTKYTGANVGKVAMLTAGMKYDATTVNATDAQLIEQLNWTVDTVCSCFHVPAQLITATHPVPWANSEPLVQMYYSQCLQSHIVALELALDDGLGLTSVGGHTYGTEFDIDDLLWMDTATRTKAATDAVTGGVLAPNEARLKYFGIGATPGGDSVYMQQQMFSLEALAERDSLKPFSAPAAPTPPPDEDAEDDDELELDAFTGLLAKALEEGGILHG